MGNTERIAAALDAVRAKMDAKDAALSEARERLDTLRGQLARLRESPLYALAPEGLRVLLEQWGEALG